MHKVKHSNRIASHEGALGHYCEFVARYLGSCAGHQYLGVVESSPLDSLTNRGRQSELCVHLGVLKFYQNPLRRLRDYDPDHSSSGSWWLQLSSQQRKKVTEIFAREYMQIKGIGHSAAVGGTFRSCF